MLSVVTPKSVKTPSNSVRMFVINREDETKLVEGHVPIDQ